MGYCLQHALFLGNTKLLLESVIKLNYDPNGKKMLFMFHCLRGSIFSPFMHVQGYFCRCFPAPQLTLPLSCVCMSGCEKWSLHFNENNKLLIMHSVVNCHLMPVNLKTALKQAWCEDLCSYANIRVTIEVESS